MASHRFWVMGHRLRSRSTALVPGVAAVPPEIADILIAVAAITAPVAKIPTQVSLVLAAFADILAALLRACRRAGSLACPAAARDDPAGSHGCRREARGCHDGSHACPSEARALRGASRAGAAAACECVDSSVRVRGCALPTSRAAATAAIPRLRMVSPRDGIARSPPWRALLYDGCTPADVKGRSPLSDPASFSVRLASCERGRFKGSEPLIFADQGL